MNAYYEVVFLSDFCVDGFLVALSCLFLKEKVIFPRLFLTASFSAASTVISVVAARLTIFLHIACLFVIPALMRKNTKFTDYLTGFLTFLLVATSFGGICLAVEKLGFLDSFSLGYGKIPIVVGSSGILLTRGVFLLKKLSSSVRLRAENEYDVVLTGEGGAVRTRATYDSGNRVYADDGERVVFVSPKVYDRIGAKNNDPLSVMTAGGVFTTIMTSGEVTMTDNRGQNVLYRVKIARSDYLFNRQVLLHGEMIGGGS